MAKVQDVSETTKRNVYAKYGIEAQAGIVCCQVDHLIGVEIGGNNDVANLWPQPYEPRPGAHEKDTLDNWLHNQVCSGGMTLTEAQHDIAANWDETHRRMLQEETRRDRVSREP